jgi:hypothetical protein
MIYHTLKAHYVKWYSEHPRGRPLTLLASADYKLRKFDEMKNAFWILIDMANRDDKITNIN